MPSFHRAHIQRYVRQGGSTDKMSRELFMQMLESAGVECVGGAQYDLPPPIQPV